MTFIITAVSIFVAAAIGVLVLAVVLARSLRAAHPGPAPEVPQGSAELVPAAPAAREVLIAAALSELVR